MQLSPVAKIILYVLLISGTVFCGSRFLARYNRMMDVEANTEPYAYTNTTPAEVESTPTEGGDEANEQGDVVDGELATGGAPAVEVEGSNEPVDAVETPAPVAPTEFTAQALTRTELKGRPDADSSGIATYAITGLFFLAALGLMIANDVSSMAARKTHKLLHNEEGEGVHSADYDEAEEVWKSGDHLEAVRLMREYLNKNPREVHVMLRIAEIYEKDLMNPLAAALEYEEVLQLKLPDERWGWAAIHLVNLYYGRLDKPDQGLALLWRIHREYGHTAAAKKARKRLLDIDPEFAKEQERLDAEEAAAAEREADDDSAFEDEVDPVQIDEDSNLPKGFRPKKR